MLHDAGNLVRTAPVVIAVLIASGGAGCASPGPVRSIDLLIVGGTVIDPARRTQTWNSGIAIDDGIIVALNASPDDFTARERLNAGNEFIMPAFIDVRAHWEAGDAGDSRQPGEIESRRSLYYGVTRIHDLMPLRAPPGASSPGDVSREVRRLADVGADSIEIVAALPPESLEAVIRAAEEVEKPLALHVASTDEFAVLNDVPNGSALQALTVAGPVDPALYQQAAGKRFFYIVSPNAAEGDAAQQSRVTDPFLLETLSDEEIESLQQDYALQPDEQSNAPDLDEPYNYARDAAYSGALLLAGSDAGSPTLFAGYSIHEELWSLADAGIEPIDVLATATSNAALFLKMQNNRGSIEAGHAADIVILSGNPLADIRNTRRIAEVIKDGSIVDRAALLDR